MADMKMLINMHEDETRIALTENDVLIDLHVQQTARERTAGNIYRGVVEKVNPAFQAAFIDYGERKNGFLSISDLNPTLYRGNDGGKGRPRIQSLLKQGQSVMVQVLKEGVGHKGAAMTTFISLPGRYVVLTPNSERHGVSRKIEDSDKRNQLKEALSSLAGGDMGVIIRTAGTDRTLPDLKKDLSALRKEWKSIESNFKKTNRPGMIRQEASTIVRVLRDYFTEDVKEVQVDSAEAFQEALGYFKAQMPKFQKRLQLYVGDKSLFSAFGVEIQIDQLDSNKVNLKSGGGIVIESTEALVSVDVNSGKANQAQDIEETALNTNLEAADEVARQLRLRNLGGLVVIDFIDMMRQKNRDKIVQVLTEALKHDKARTTVGSISQFGMLELSRQRIDMDLTHGLREQCANCGGTGYIPTVSVKANQVLRKIREYVASGRFSEVHGSVSVEQANYLNNAKRESLRDLELEFEVTIRLEGDPNVADGQPVTLKGIPLQGEEEADLVMDADPADDAQVEDSAEHARGRRRPRRRPRRGETGEDRDRTSPDVAASAAGESADAEDGEEIDDSAKRPDSEHAARGAAAQSAQAPAASSGANGTRNDRSRATRPGANGSAATASTGLVPPPVPFSVKKRGPKIFIVDPHANLPNGEAFFISNHEAATAESPVNIPVPPNLKDAFKILAANVEIGDMVWDSHHTGSVGGGEAAPKKSGARSGSSRRGRGRGRKPAAAGPSAEAAGDAKSAGTGGKSPSRRRGRGRKPAAAASDTASA